MFIYHSPATHLGRVTVVAEQTDKGLVIGVARCTPNDNFSRAFGRDLALKRIKEGLEYDCISFPDCNQYYFSGIALTIAKQALLHPEHVTPKKKV